MTPEPEEKPAEKTEKPKKQPAKPKKQEEKKPEEKKQAEKKSEVKPIEAPSSTPTPPADDAPSPQFKYDPKTGQLSLFSDDDM